MATLETMAPELRVAMRRVPPIPFGSPIARRLVRWLGARRPTASYPGITIEIVGRLRIYRPEARRAAAALLWVHGGGYLIGGPNQDDRFCARVSAELGIPIVSAGYRLAPEHPFPAALDDLRAGWGWLQENADKLGVDPRRVVIGGASAGGGLAATLAQRLHDEDGPGALAQWLFAPMLDDRTAARRDLDAFDHPVWNNRTNRIAWRAYLGAEPGLPILPPYAAASRRTDLRDLPTAWIGIGALDLFHEDALAYAARLGAAGVEVTMDVVAGAPHGFEAWGFATPIAQAFEARAIDWLARRIAVQL